MAFPSIQKSNPEVLAASRGVKKGKQRQPMHGGALPSKTRAHNAMASLPEAEAVATFLPFAFILLSKLEIR